MGRGKGEEMKATLHFRAPRALKKRIERIARRESKKDGSDASDLMRRWLAAAADAYEKNELKNKRCTLTAPPS